MARRASGGSQAAGEEKTRLPTANDIDRLLGLSVKASDGSSVSFKSIVDDAEYPRVLTVFIRHFFCGFCEQYITALGNAIPPSYLASLSPPTKLVVIGCGAPSLISAYASRTKCPYTIYADPDRSTYDALGFATTLTLSDGNAPAYASASYVSTVWSSFVTGIHAGKGMLSGGKTSQQGGEVCWTNGHVDWIERMKATIDHLDVDVLKKRLEA